MAVTENGNTKIPPYKGWSNDAGFNANVDQREPISSVVKGRLPHCVAGTLYRTGPGHYMEKTASGEFELSHWFDGFSQVHRFQLTPDENDNCTVTYTSRNIMDSLLEHVRKTGHIDSITFGQKRDPCESMFQKLKSTFVALRADPQERNIGVTISRNPSGLPITKDGKAIPFDSDIPRLVVKTDNCNYRELDIETLEPMGVTSQSHLHPELKGQLSCAHPQIDHETGDLYNYNLEFGQKTVYRIFRTSFKTGKTDILATIQDKSIPAAYIHSLFMTPDFIILAIWGSHISNGLKVLWDRNMLDAINPVDPKVPVKWLVIDRKGGRGVIAKFESPAMFAFHSVNAWQEPSSTATAEDDGSVDIFCEIVQYPTLDILHKFYYKNLVSTGPGVANYMSDEIFGKTRACLVRYRLPSIPISGKVSNISQLANLKAEIIFEILSPKAGELPTINPAFSTRKHRFVYSVLNEGYSSWVDGICKTDTVTKKSIIWRVPRHTPGEPIFVADKEREGEGEDAGFLLSVVLDGDRGVSYLVCLNAGTMEEVGRAEVGIPVGMGFHGAHYSD